MQLRPEAGVWETFVPGLKQGARYKYHVVSRYNGYKVAKADPYAFYSELRPGTASRVWDLECIPLARFGMDEPPACYSADVPHVDL